MHTQTCYEIVRQIVLRDYKTWISVENKQKKYTITILCLIK